MILYVDTETRKLRRSVADSREVNSLQFKRGDSAEIQLVFVSANTQVELADGSVITFGIKSDGIFDGEFLVSTSDFTKSGSGATAVYTGNPSFNTTALNTALGVDLATNNDIARLKVGVEISWEDGVSGAITSTETITGYVNNDVIKGDEGTPLEEDSPVDWLSANGIVYDPAITGLTGGGVTKLDGITTAGVDVGRTQYLVAGGYSYLYTLKAGTLLEDGYHVIRPDDYHASTNTKYWSLVQMRIKALAIDGMGYIAEISFSGTANRTVDLGDADGTLPPLPAYSSLSAANAAEAAIGIVFWNTTSGKAQVTTATS